jgi:hypothetical protein
MNTDRPAALWPVTTRRIALGMDVSEQSRSKRLPAQWNRFAAQTRQFNKLKWFPIQVER